MENLKARNLPDIHTLINICSEYDPRFVKPLETIKNFEHFDLLNPYGLQAISAIIIDAIDSDTSDLDRIYQLLFDPQIASQESIEKFRKWHKGRHLVNAPPFANALFNVPGQIVLLKSGMYGGKSTLADIICSNLEAVEFKRFSLVPDVMDENLVTMRGKKGYGESRDHQREAIKIGENNWQQVISQIEQEMSLEDDPTEAIIHFDEYSFLPAKLVQEIVKTFRNKGYRILLAGLDTDYLGRQLPAYEALSRSARYTYSCMSYIHDQDGMSPEPEGSMTIRHIMIDGQWILDLGFAKLVIPKGRSYALYTPGRIEDHIISLLSDHELLLNSIHNPNKSQITNQENLIAELDKAEEALTNSTEA